MKYSNPWSSHRKPSLLTVLSALHLRESNSRNKNDLPPAPKSYPADFTEPTFNPGTTDEVSHRVMWLGHASVYLQVTGPDRVVGILFDPIFSSR
jgi:hypothetical protein